MGKKLTKRASRKIRDIRERISLHQARIDALAEEVYSELGLCPGGESYAHDWVFDYLYNGEAFESSMRAAGFEV